MIGFKTFLTESDRVKLLDVTPEEFGEILKRDCSQILDAYSATGWKHGIYRGEDSLKAKLKDQKNESSINAFEATIRTDRKPVELDASKHEKFNDAMLRNGFSAHRGNSIFTTSEYELAKSWGKPCLIFPKDGFKFVWFEGFEKRGLSKSMYVFSMIDDSDLERRERGRGGDKEAIDKLWDDLVINELGASDKNINAAIAASEMLFSGPGYYGVPVPSSMMLASMPRYLKLN